MNSFALRERCYYYCCTFVQSLLQTRGFGGVLEARKERNPGVTGALDEEGDVDLLLGGHLEDLLLQFRIFGISVRVIKQAGARSDDPQRYKRSPLFSEKQKGIKIRLNLFRTLKSNTLGSDRYLLVGR